MSEEEPAELCLGCHTAVPIRQYQGWMAACYIHHYLSAVPALLFSSASVIDMKEESLIAEEGV